MNKSITIENRLILTRSQWTLHQMHETYWKVPMLSFWDHSLLPKKHNLPIQIPIQKEWVLYLTATCVSCQTWVRQTSGDNGWKLSQDDSSLLEKNDMGGEKKGTGDLSPTLTGESTKQKFKLSLSSLLAFYHQRLLYFLQHEGIRGITTPQCGRHSLWMVSMLACGLRSLSLCPSHNICFVQNTQSTLTVLFTTAEYKWLLANCWESLSKC